MSDLVPGHRGKQRHAIFQRRHRLRRHQQEADGSAQEYRICLFIPCRRERLPAQIRVRGRPPGHGELGVWRSVRGTGESGHRLYPEQFRRAHGQNDHGRTGLCLSRAEPHDQYRRHGGNPHIRHFPLRNAALQREIPMERQFVQPWRRGLFRSDASRDFERHSRPDDRPANRIFRLRYHKRPTHRHPSRHEHRHARFPRN